jgi:hypothetical protein
MTKRIPATVPIVLSAFTAPDRWLIAGVVQHTGQP